MVGLAENIATQPSLAGALAELGNNGLPIFTLTYIKQIRSLLEFGVPVWNSGITQEEIHDIE